MSYLFFFFCNFNVLEYILSNIFGFREKKHTFHNTWNIPVNFLNLKFWDEKKPVLNAYLDKKIL